MTIGLVQNSRDSDMIELCGQNSSNEWIYVWGAIHCDGIGDAIEGELRGDRRTFKTLVECVIISKSDWDLFSDELKKAQQEIEQLEDEIAYLRKVAPDD